MSSVYATVAEFQNYPTGLDLQNLIVGGTSAQNAQQLGVVLQFASSQVDQYCYQRLYAESVTEVTLVRPGPYGLTVRMGRFPVTNVATVPASLALQWRQTSRGGWNLIPAANLTILGALQGQVLADDQDYRVYTGWGQAPITVQATYVHGYPNPTLASAAAAGATSFAVDDATGLQDGTALTFYDLGLQESVTVGSVSGTTVTIASSGTLQYAHAAGVRASALPASVTNACILIAAWYLKERRAGGAIVMSSGGLQPVNINTDMDMEAVRLLLQPFRRVV